MNDRSNIYHQFFHKNLNIFKKTKQANNNNHTHSLFLKNIFLTKWMGLFISPFQLIFKFIINKKQEGNRGLWRQTNKSNNCRTSKMFRMFHIMLHTWKYNMSTKAKHIRSQWCNYTIKMNYWILIRYRTALALTIIQPRTN